MELLLFLVLIGVVGTVIGALLAIAMGRRSDAMICYLLAFAGGIMVAIAMFELIPEAAEKSNNWIAILGVAIGVAIVFLLNLFIDHLKKTNKEEEQSNQTSKTRMMRAGIIMLVALALHNFPEGLAMGAVFSYEVSLGITIAVLLALHNIPEGMAIAAALKAGGMKVWKIIAWVIVMCIPILVGAVLGFWIGEMSDMAKAVSLAVAGGAMLYVVFGEVIPRSSSMVKSNMPAVVAMLGIIIGLLIVGIEFGW